MKCKNCSEEIWEYYEVCPHCGVKVTHRSENKPSLLSIMAFVLSFFVPVAGIVVGSIGTAKSQYSLGRILSVAAIVISVCMLGLHCWLVYRGIVKIIEIIEQNGGL